MPETDADKQTVAKLADHRVVVVAILCGFIASIAIGRLAAITERYVLDHTTPIIAQAPAPTNGG